MKVRDIAQGLGATVVGSEDLEVRRAVHPAHATGNGDLAVALARDLIPLLGETAAAAALLPAGVEAPEGAPETLIQVPMSRQVLSEVTRIFRFEPAVGPGVHASAVVEEGAVVDATASIGPFCHVSSGATIGARTVLLSHCAVMSGATIGEDGLLYPGVKIGPGVAIGARAVIHSNAAIGSDGFSFLPVDPGHVESVKASGKIVQNPDADATLLKVHSLGAVEIGDDVEIGAQTAIDAGTLLPTRIGRGTKIDNLVMIGHNVQIGEDCLLCGQVGLAGSVTIGDRCVLAGGAGVADHLTIGDDVVVGGGSGVGTNLRSGEFYMGAPAVPHNQAVRNLQNLKRLDRVLSKMQKGGG